MKALLILVLTVSCIVGFVGLLYLCPFVYYGRSATSPSTWWGKARGALLCITVVGVYLNIGWFLGEWFCTNVMGRTPDTTLEMFAAGGWEVFATLVFDRQAPILTYVFGWLPLLAFILLSWILKGAVIVLWIIFAGGGVDLVKGIFD